MSYAYTNLSAFSRIGSLLRAKYLLYHMRYPRTSLINAAVVEHIVWTDSTAKGTPVPLEPLPYPRLVMFVHRYMVMLWGDRPGSAPPMRPLLGEWVQSVIVADMCKAKAGPC